MKGEAGPTATKTTLGWVLSGPTDFSSSNCVSTNLVSSHILQVGCVPDVLVPSDRDSQLIEEVKEFWLTEETGVESNLENNTYDIIKSVIYENRSYSVPLPWKLNPDDLPDNYSLANARLHSLFRRLKKSPEYLKKYDEIIRNQEKECIIEQVNRCDPKNDGHAHYIPHREVIKEERITTKMRVVYDASAKRKGLISLNDALETGPCLLPKMFDIIVRLRAYRIAIISDIKSAFFEHRYSSSRSKFP